MSPIARLRISARSSWATRGALVAIALLILAAALSDVIPAGSLRALAQGARHALIVGTGAALLSVATGALIGSSAALSTGAWDGLVARGLEVLGAFPGIVLVALVCALAPDAGLAIWITALALVRLPESTRLVRAEVICLKTAEFTHAARALGVPRSRIVSRHLAPHLAPFVAESLVLTIGVVVLMDGAMSLLGLGTVSAAVSWGSMIAYAIAGARPQDALLPAAAVVGSVLALARLSEALREALDPHAAATPPLRGGKSGSR